MNILSSLHKVSEIRGQVKQRVQQLLQQFAIGITEFKYSYPIGLASRHKFNSVCLSNAVFHLNALLIKRYPGDCRHSKAFDKMFVASYRGADLIFNVGDNAGRLLITRHY